MTKVSNPIQCKSSMSEGKSGLFLKTDTDLRWQLKCTSESGSSWVQSSTLFMLYVDVSTLLRTAKDCPIFLKRCELVDAAVVGLVISSILSDCSCFLRILFFKLWWKTMYHNHGLLSGTWVVPTWHPSQVLPMSFPPTDDGRYHYHWYPHHDDRVIKYTYSPAIFINLAHMASLTAKSWLCWFWSLVQKAALRKDGSFARFADGLACVFSCSCWWCCSLLCGEEEEKLWYCCRE